MFRILFIFTLQFWKGQEIYFCSGHQYLQRLFSVLLYFAMHHVIYGSTIITYHSNICIWFMYFLWHIVEFQLKVYFCLHVLFRHVFGWYLFDRIPSYKWHIEIAWNSNVCDNDASKFLYSQDTLEVDLVKTPNILSGLVFPTGWLYRFGLVGVSGLSNSEVFLITCVIFRVIRFAGISSEVMF